MKCPDCGTELTDGCFVELEDGSKHARCHGCLAFVVIEPGASEPEPAEPNEPAEPAG